MDGKERNKIAVHKYRAQKRTLPATYTDADWQQTLKDFRNCCAYCGKPSDVLHQEHFVPLSKDGPYTPGNILPVCPNCNLSKSAKDPQDFLPPNLYKKLEGYLSRRDKAVQYTFWNVTSS